MNNKNKLKRSGQISIFIIIAIIVVVLIGIIALVKQENLNPGYSNDESYNYISGCLEQTGEHALGYIGDMGGYYYIPEKSTDYGTPYYFYDNKNIIPTLKNVENEISKFVNLRGSLCGYIENTQYKVISRGNVTTKTKIYDDKVEMNIKYPITVEKGDKKMSYQNFNIVIPGRVGILYNASKEYIEEQTQNPGGICISCINDLANKYNIKFITYNYDNSTIIFNIYDNNTKINNQSFYVYTFAVKYDSNQNLSL